jgi:hypothetical protein
VRRGREKPVLVVTAMLGFSPSATMNTNFKFFAFAYLSDWWQYDADFVSRLSAGYSFRRECLVEAASYYQVVRSFNKKRGDAGSPRMTNALDILDRAFAEVNGSITQENVDTLVTSLAREFRKVYPPPPRKEKQRSEVKHKKNAQQIKKEAPGLISAASKFLWLLHKTPVVIYDDRACRCLNSLAGAQFSTEDYSAYRAGWNVQFKQFEPDILSACSGLTNLETFAPDEEAKTSLRSQVGERWFLERVFDKFLWWNGKQRR